MLSLIRRPDLDVVNALVIKVLDEVKETIMSKKSEL